MDAHALLRVADLSALAAGHVLMQAAGSRLDVQTKSSAADVVTRADVAAEEAVRTTIRRHRPGDTILGEEGGEEHGRTSIRWVVDPLDGTVNYVAGIADWSVSIAAELIGGGGGVVAVVHLPAQGRRFSASRGLGAWCDGARLPLRARTPAPLAESVVATGFSRDPKRRRGQADELARVLPHVRDVRCRGAASLELCAVASGEADAYFEDGLQPWDVAAGRLIAVESGAHVTGGPGTGAPLVAGREPIVGALVRLLQHAGDER